MLNDENGRRLETTEEVVEAFKNRLQRTFKISEKENKKFDEDKERERELNDQNNASEYLEVLFLLVCSSFFVFVFTYILGLPEIREPGNRDGFFSF